LQRQIATYPLASGQYKSIKQKMLNWAQQFSIFLFLDSNDYESAYGKYECLLGAGVLAGDKIDSLRALQTAHDTHQDWLLGHITYDYKNNIEPKLSSQHPAKTGFPDLYFFRPEVVCYISSDTTAFVIETITSIPGIIYAAIVSYDIPEPLSLPKVDFKHTFGKEEYIDAINILRGHIGDGDCYEINFCTEGFADNVITDPLDVFHALNKLSPAPFAACYRLKDRYVMCASPERYIQKTGATLLAQPIKGTARRDADPQTDDKIKNALQQDIKERAENVMIVDLMRNDLARCCEPGSVQVDELFGIYSFPQVHQMISTVSGALKQNVPFTEAMRTTFPMGSMTGAPKMKVMELVDKYEHSRRELFSGTVGYITPGGDFDFNVIIRSLFYNAASNYLSYQTGGAITYDSVPEKEWEEMRLKAWALERIFQS
jgi:para-aminobenzoate synthetase component 1